MCFYVCLFLLLFLTLNNKCTVSTHSSRILSPSVKTDVQSQCNFLGMFIEVQVHHGVW